MKQDSIQQLFEKYREGTLSTAELAELNRLTHKDEVLDAASHRAGRIIMRRRVTWASMAVVVLLVAGMGIRAIAPSSEAPVLMAEHNAPSNVQQQLAEETLPNAPQIKEEPTITVATPRTLQRPKVATVKRVVTVPALPVEEKPVVVCNNQCEADSVINDIKRFLAV